MTKQEYRNAMDGLQPAPGMESRVRCGVEQRLRRGSRRSLRSARMLIAAAAMTVLLVTAYGLGPGGLTLLLSQAGQGGRLIAVEAGSGQGVVQCRMRAPYAVGQGLIVQRAANGAAVFTAIEGGKAVTQPGKRVRTSVTYQGQAYALEFDYCVYQGGLTISQPPQDGQGAYCRVVAGGTTAFAGLELVQGNHVMYLMQYDFECREAIDFLSGYNLERLGEIDEVAWSWSMDHVALYMRTPTGGALYALQPWEGFVQQIGGFDGKPLFFFFQDDYLFYYDGATGRSVNLRDGSSLDYWPSHDPQDFMMGDPNGYALFADSQGKINLFDLRQGTHGDEWILWHSPGMTALDHPTSGQALLLEWGERPDGQAVIEHARAMNLYTRELRPVPVPCENAVRALWLDESRVLFSQEDGGQIWIVDLRES